MMRQRTDRHRGFSIIELVLVVAIMLAIAAMALPRFLGFTATYQLRNGLTGVSGVLQQTRENAVRQNTNIAVVKTVLVGTGSSFFSDPNGNGTWDAGEPGAQLPKLIQIKSSGFPGDAYSLAVPSAIGGPQSQSTAVTFNSRGLPCVFNGANCQNLDSTNKPVGFVIYVQNTGKYGQTGWGAVTITPAGRVQTWIWNGNAYSKQ